MSDQDLAILTKKKSVKLETENEETKIEIILYPFAWKHFNETIDLINKYWVCYEKTRNEYTEEFNKIIQETKEDKDDSKRELLIKTLKAQFNEIASLVKNILESNKDNLGEDIEKIIRFCLHENIDFASLHFGEVACLLAGAIEVNMDFFDQNLKNSTLLIEINQEIPESNQENPQDGELKSVA